jgi:DNA-binding transcriptional LysR family regulator
MAASPEEILEMVFFARVVEARSFTGAAAKLGVSKSVVSARVAALEDRLKARLLHRTTRKLSLTPDGLALYEHCAQVVSAADEAAAAAAGTGDLPRGLLRINAPSAFAQDHLAEPMAAYLERYPDVRIELTMTDKLIDLVEEGIDLAIRVVTALKDAGLVARKLASDHTVVCAAPAYLARRGTPRFRDPGSKQVYSAPVDGRFSAASGALLREAAVAGMGLAVLPTFMIGEHLASGRLRTVVDSFVGVDLGVYAVYPQGPRAPGKVRTFVDLLVAHFRVPRWPGAGSRAGRP